ncbi:NHL repeat-containing protein 3 isoform X3 [Podarcis muralis]
MAARRYPRLCRLLAGLGGAASLVLLISLYTAGSEVQVGWQMKLWNQCLESIMEWVRASKQKINPGKMEVLLMHGNEVLSELTFFPLWRREKPLYKLDVNWPLIPFTGQTFCVAVDDVNGLVYVGQRGDENVPKVVVYTEDGYFLQAWNASIEMPHGIFVLNTPNATSVWITDVGTGKYGHTIKQYTPSGELLQVIGTAGRAGSGTNPLQFDQPAEIFVEESGDIYIVDGDGGLNNRLVKLTPDFKTLWLHGENGSGTAQFNIPHSVTVDAVGRVWVADRANWRIQAFQKTTGEWLGCWNSCFTQDGPSSVRSSNSVNGILLKKKKLPASANRRGKVLCTVPLGNLLCRGVGAGICAGG